MARAIVSLLSGLVLGYLLGGMVIFLVPRGNGHELSRLAYNMGNLRRAIDDYRAQNGEYPRASPDLYAWLRRECHDGFPLLGESARTDDPWGNEIIYERPDAGAPPQLRSLGANCEDDHGARDDLTYVFGSDATHVNDGFYWNRDRAEIRSTIYPACGAAVIWIVCVIRFARRHTVSVLLIAIPIAALLMTYGWMHDSPVWGVHRQHLGQTMIHAGCGVISAAAVWSCWPLLVTLYTRFTSSHTACMNCGYDIRGLVNSRCPECGAPIDQSHSEPPP